MRYLPLEVARGARPWASRLAAVTERSATIGAAFALDRAVGDPVRPTHPARVMGYVISGYEKIARMVVSSPGGERQAGTVLAVGLPLVVMAGTADLLRRVPWYLRPWAEIWLVGTALAGRDLGVHARRVEGALDRSLDEGRHEVARIVGRDTAAMSEDDVVRATIETVAENTSDGVVAPLLYAVAGGAPLALGFKAVSTLDSMVGYKNDRYLHLGRASARLDDAANYIPARVTAVLATMAAGKGPGAVRRWWQDRAYHASPNAGLVEAAFAQGLEVRLGGPAVYGGRLIERPAVGGEFRPPVRADIEGAVALSERVGQLALGLGLVALWLSAWGGAEAEPVSPAPELQMGVDAVGAAAVGADLHGGKIREVASALGRPATDLLDVSANVNFLGPTPSVVAAARRAVDEMGWYPLDPPVSLRRAAADFLRVPEETVLLGNGASELIFVTVAHVRPRRVLIVGPTFTEYERAARAWGADVDVLWMSEEQDYALTAEDLAARGVAERIRSVDLVFYCEPNNPTGRLLDRGARSVLLDLCAEADVPVFADESFLGFTAAWPEGSVTREHRRGVIVLHSFTKILAVPGLRVGALAVPPDVAAVLGPRVPPWNINCVAQAAAMAGFAETAMLEQTAAATAAARASLAGALSRVAGIERVLPSDANFLCLRLEQARAAAVAHRLCDEQGVLVRDLSSFPGMGPRYLRVAVRTPEENSRVTAAFDAVLSAAVPPRAVGVA